LLVANEGRICLGDTAVGAQYRGGYSIVFLISDVLGQECDWNDEFNII